MTSPACTRRAGPFPRENSTPTAPRPPALEQDPRDERPGLHVEVRTAHDRMEVGAGRGEASAAADVAVEGREALLAEAVDVVAEGVTGLLHGREEGPEQGAAGRAALPHQRPVVAAEL